MVIIDHEGVGDDDTHAGDITVYTCYITTCSCNKLLNYK